MQIREANKEQKINFIAKRSAVCLKKINLRRELLIKSDC